MRGFRWAFLVGLMMPACGNNGTVAAEGGACEAGTELCPCYANGTCEAGLECLSELCVNDGQSGGTSSGGTSSGGTSTGGTSTGGTSTGGTSTGGTSTGGTSTGGTSTGGTSTGGTGGNQDNQCWQQLSPPPEPSDVCGTCQFNKCCDELLACIPGGGACGALIQCAYDACGNNNQCVNDVINQAANGQGVCAGSATQQALQQLMAMYGQTGCVQTTCGSDCGGGSGGSGGSGGAGGAGGSGGEPPWCTNPIICPNNGSGQPCCVTGYGPCGYRVGGSCSPDPGDI